MLRRGLPKEAHDCQLQTQSISMLPKLHPNASLFRRALRRLRILVLVSGVNPKTRLVFRSEDSICMERKRQIKLYPVCVIHPYSIINMMREIIMSIAWFAFFSLHSFKIGFIDDKKNNLFYDVSQAIFLVLHVLHLISCFFTGYHDKKNREIVLEWKKCVTRYLPTYFVFDFAVLLPKQQFMDRKHMYWVGLIIHLMASPRFITMGYYFRQITLLLDVGDMMHELLCLIIGGLFLAHWWAVIVYAYPNFRQKFYVSINETLWTHDAKISREFTNVSLETKYIQSLHKASALFFGVSKGMWVSETTGEWLIFSMIILSGVLYLSYITAVILQLSMSYKMSESMYDKMAFQLFQYTKAKKLPDRLQVRLRLYYEAKFREKYFREHVILNTLSEHLRYEIIYHNCQQFIQTTWFFEDLPKAIVAHIIASLTSTVLITNEVILNEEEFEEPNLYFISSGSVALYSLEGNELLHIEDGDYFGENNILGKMTKFQVSELTKNIRVVAAEITELFVLKMDDFVKYIGNYPQAIERITQVAMVRDNLNVRILDRKHQYEDHDIAAYLQKANFLGKGRLRQISKKHRYGAAAPSDDV